MAGTAARCTSIKFGSTEVADPISAKIIEDPELIKKVYSDANVGRYYKGEEIAGLTVTFSDLATYKAYKKGSYVASLVVTMAGANEITSTGSTAAANAVTATLTHGIVTEAVEFESTSGEPAQFSITVMIARVGSNTGSLAVV